MSKSSAGDLNWNSVWREQVLPTLAEQSWDLIVVGGGIIGAGIIREAARRGWRCLLLEQRDFAWGTSSRSSKMVHGGLRYLSQGEFALTRDSVRERQRLLTDAPGLVEPMQYLYPHYRGEFPGRWLFTGVLCLYDRFAGQSLHQFYPARKVSERVPGLQLDNLVGASQFQDAVTDDARLVMHVLAEARALGACIVNNVQVLQPLYSADSTASGDLAEHKVIGVQIKDTLSGQQWRLSCQAVAQATGVWTDVAALSGQRQYIRPLRGSHLLIPHARLPVQQALSFKHPQDQRLMFIYPWEGATVVGTTDIDHHSDANQEAFINQTEVDYLLAGCAKIFPDARITQDDIISTWSGVRPIVTKSGKGGYKPSDESREHMLWIEPGRVSIAGGKLTTFRLLALEVLQACAVFNGRSMQETAEAAQTTVRNPPDNCLNDLSAQIQRRLYGRYRADWLNFCNMFKQLGAEQIIATPIFWAELAYACEHELVIHLDDLLLRRTRVGLLVARGGLALLDDVRFLCQSRLGWDDQRWNQEQQRYLAIYQQFYSVPNARAVTVD